MRRLSTIFSLSYDIDFIVVLALIFALLPMSTHAKPLSLDELNRFNDWVQCSEKCEKENGYELASSPSYKEQELRYLCIANDCGAPARSWEKDGTRLEVLAGEAPRVYSIDRHDLQLAILEFQSQRSIGVDGAPNELDATRNDGTGRPEDLVCYPENYLEDSTSESNAEDRISGVVIAGSLCPYDRTQDEDERHFGCPHLSRLDADDDSSVLPDSFSPLCSAAACGQPQYLFDDSDRNFVTVDADGIQWGSTFRPLACPQVVCDLYQAGGDLEEDAGITNDPDLIEQLCAPSDVEGQAHVPQWLNRQLASEGLTACDVSQSNGYECSLSERCVYEDRFGRGVCRPRDECRGSGSCPVMHLELKSESDQEVIVWIYFDHSDAPVRVLDLHLNYPKTQMVLADSRRLPALLYAGGPDGKELTTTHLADGTLRVSVFDSNSSDPIPYGPIIELVFQRAGQYGLCHDLNQNEMKDLLFDEQRSCHQEFVTCERNAQNDRSADFDVLHASVYTLEENTLCVNTLMECLEVPAEYRSDKFRLINPSFEARADENGDGDINAADQFYNEDTNRDGWVDARDCEDFVISFTDREDLRSMSMAPNGADAQVALSEDSAWGSDIQLQSRVNADLKMKLWYDFTSSSLPLKYKNIPSAAELCAQIAECANEPEESFKQKYIRDLQKLQGGVVSISDEIEGVERQAAYFDGSRSHIQMPIVIAPELQRDAQSFSFSTWFYAEGKSEYESLDTPQILFAHNDFSERTRFGLWLQETSQSNAMELTFFDGDYLSYAGSNEILTTSIDVIDKRKWQHLALNFDMESRQVNVYLNGRLSETIDLTSGIHPFTCPQFSRNVNLLLHEEGDFLGGSSADALYIAVRKSGSYQIEEWSSRSNEARRVVLDSGSISYRDPDYSPIIDRLVYSSNATGSYEIWMSDGQGENQQQITVDFGDAERNIQARNPRWAPDGSGIIFESNIYDVLAGDNTADTVFHLYYIAYDSREQKVAIPLLSGETSEQLNYTQRLQDQSLVFYRLTDLDQVHHHRKVRWLRGSYDVVTFNNGEESTQKRLGKIIYERSTPTYQNKKIAQIVLDEQIPLSTFQDLNGLRLGNVTGEELSLLDAHHSVRNTTSGTIMVDRLMYKRSYSEYTQANEDQRDASSITFSNEQGIFKFTLVASTVPSGMPPVFVGTIAYQVNPNDLGDNCWDQNQNGLMENIEDLDKNGLWNDQDCYQYALNNLYFSFDENIVNFEDSSHLNDATKNPSSILIGRYAKEVGVKSIYAPGESFVSVQVDSPYNSYPLVPVSSNDSWLNIAKLKFSGKTSDTSLAEALASIVALKSRETYENYVISDLNPHDRCWDLNFNGLNEVREDRNEDGIFDQDDCDAPEFKALGIFELLKSASFSPDGDTLLLNVISQSRPILLYNPDLIDTTYVERLSQDYPKTAGISWRKQERFAACQWIGAYRHPLSKNLIDSFRGGLDEMKYFTGLRSIDSIRSEFTRGFEWLDRQSMAGLLPSSTAVCGNSHSECPPYHLCINQTCQLKPCDPADPATCRASGGQCTLLPVTIEPENLEGSEQDFSWVCAADCTFDRECYTQNCLNGPCLYCDRDRSTCSECRDVEVDLNGAVVRRVEGCPDERTFYCDAGACLTECYSFEDDQSLYLCDPVTEYCSRGRCVLNEWEWHDLSPMTWLAAFDARYDLDPGNWTHYTAAIGEKYPLAIYAYGVNDYGQYPEVLVEVSGGPYYGLNWHTLNRVMISNRTQDEANQNPVILDSSHPYRRARMRLITSPYSNVMNGATGLGGKDKDFCRDDIQRSGVSDTRLCHQRAQGSRYNLGYRVSIPTHEAVKACRAHSHAGCPSQSNSEHDHLYGGTAGVVIVDVKANGGSIMGNKQNNQICSYEGKASPMSANGGPKKLFYGSILDEDSNQLEHYCLQSEEECLENSANASTATISFDSAIAVLNCNYYNPDDPSDSAGVTFANIPFLLPASEKGNIVLDNGDQCLIEIDALRNTTCYEWYGGAVSLDPYTIPVTQRGTLDLSAVRSFAHDEGFTKVPPPYYNLNIQVEGNHSNDHLAGLEVTELANGLPSLNPRTGSNGTVRYRITQNYEYDLRITQQPAFESLKCSFINNAQTFVANSSMTQDETLTIRCVESYKVGGCIRKGEDSCQDLSYLQDLDGKSVSIKLEAQDLNAQWRLISFKQKNLSSLFAFDDTPLALGMIYRVSIIQSPTGYLCTWENTGAQGTIFESSIAANSLTNLSILCSEVPTYLTQDQVYDLDSEETLTIKHVNSGLTQVVSRASLDANNYIIPGFVVDEGNGYQLEIVEQPYYQICSFDNDSFGTQSQGVRINCADRDRNFLSISFMNVPVNEQVAVRLDVLQLTSQQVFNAAGIPETVDTWTIAPQRSQVLLYAQDVDLSSNSELIFNTSSMGMFEGDRYRLSIDASQTSDGVRCSVDINPSNFVQSEDFDFQSFVLNRVISCRDVDFEEGLAQYVLSGQIFGLGNREGLRLIPFEAGPELEIAANANTFEFIDTLFSRNDDYEVQVGQHPVGGYCEVRNGSGEIQADINTVEVHCQPAYTVQIALSNMDGLNADDNVGVKVQLFSKATSQRNAKLVAKDDGSIIVGDNASVTFDLQDLDDQVASLPQGDYSLYIWINMNGNTDSNTGDPLFEFEDRALYANISLSGNEAVKTFAYQFSHFTNVIPIIVSVPAPESVEDEEEYQNAAMDCMVSPADGVNGRRAGIRGLPYPRADYKPIISTATRICTSDCDDTDAHPMYLTNLFGYAVQDSLVDIFCIVDKNNDNVLNRGEIYAIGNDISPFPLITLNARVY